MSHSRQLTPEVTHFTDELRRRSTLRKYAFRSILMLITSFILLHLIQLTEYCREKEIGSTFVITANTSELKQSKHGGYYVRKGAMFLTIPQYQIQSSEDLENPTVLSDLLITVQVEEKKNVFHSISSSEITSTSSDSTRLKMGSKNSTNTELEDGSNSPQMIEKFVCQIRLISKEIEVKNHSADSGLYVEGHFLAWREKNKTWLRKIFNESLLPTHAAFIYGVVFGGDDNLPQNRADQFQIVGMTHILVASGYNVMVVSTSLLSLTQLFLSFRMRRIVALIFIWIYAFIGGLTAPIVRATLMISVVLISQLYGRQQKTSWAFWLTILILLLWNPWFLFEISFQLSVLATAGLIWISPLIETFFAKFNFKTTSLNGKFLFDSIKENLFATISALLLTTPLIVYHFERLSLISVVANSVLLLFIPILMAFGVIIVGSWLIHPFLAKALGLVCDSILFVFFELVEIFSSPKWASVVFTVTGRQMVIVYGLIIFSIFYFHRQFNKRPK